VSVYSTQRVFTRGAGKGYEKLNKASNENEFAVCRRNSYSRVSSFLIAVILLLCSSAPLGPLFLYISLVGCRGDEQRADSPPAGGHHLSAKHGPLIALDSN